MRNKATRVGLGGIHIFINKTTLEQAMKNGGMDIEQRELYATAFPHSRAISGKAVIMLIIDSGEAPGEIQSGMERESETNRGARTPQPSD